ncbi:hypothetical protein E2N92_01715 [Methanofollis formosanus]|uniref:Uncharacterized protein n=1 Tax=Methanofollis formosanus TaxID=299308 RepID=A0A8G1A0N3_9EURY|nr:hypothetical protein [Methanofollis formosanus]QYZ78234.1 hypothetical protein E2N92_01715 [Methanofollis formosanus]
MSGDGPINGSPHIEPCSNTSSRRSATFPSSREEIKSVGPVPLYLVPPVVTAAVNRIGGALSELHAWRSRRHFYEVTLVIREEKS